LKDKDDKESKFPLTKEKIIHNFNSIFFAATDTTSHTALIAYYMISERPDIQ